MKNKNLSLLIILLFCSFSAFSQEKPQKIIIDLKGRFSKTYSDWGVNTNQFSGNEKTTDVNFSIGYALNNHWIIGVGVEYYKQKEQRLNSLYFPNMYVQVTTTDLKTEALLPELYLAYDRNLVGNLYFNTTWTILYGKVREDNSFVCGIKDSSSGISGSSVFGGSKVFYNELLRSYIKPSLVYYVFPHCGLNLELGGLDYQLNKMDFDLAQWNVSFNPSNWRVGIQLRF